VPVIVRPDVPPSLLVCAAQPTPETMKNDADLAYYILDLAQAGDECRRKLEKVKELLE
jgi:hypothetical protein